ncbi:unnamed protein product [Adineta steineri]|uniref:G protein-coupled receptor n=1 Tax=Adineta steineri TaxID=433720 RepID=A0A819NPD8_9BILA|nr:unnamed protein product [Adineta steineri]CAF4001003.1 unnamed protein product [Adineta steineri]
MSTFGILTIINFRKIRNRIAPQSDNSRNERWRSHDRQLIIMLLVQVLITTLFAIPFASLSTWNIFTVTIFKYKLSTFEQSLYNFGSEVARSLSYTNPVIGFYIYSLTGSKFRAEMKHCIEYGLKFALTSIGLMRYMPLRVQQALRTEPQMDSNDDTATRNRRGNAIQHQRTIIMTTAV